MTNDATPAESSPAPTGPTDVLASLSPAEYDTWNLTGALPKNEPETPHAAPSADQPVEQAASTEVTEAASEAANRPRKTGEDRKRELAAEIESDLKRRADLRADIAREEARLQALRHPQKTDDQPAASSPAPAKAAITYPPDLANYDAYLMANPEKSYEEFMDDRADFRSDAKEQARKTETEDARRAESHAQTRQQRNEKFAAQLEAAKKADPAFLDSISPDVLRLKPFEALKRDANGWRDPVTGQYVQPGYAAIAEEVLSSDVAGPLMRHFSEHPEDFHRLAKLEPRPLMREIAVIEDGLKKKPAAAPLKTVTDAPPLLRTLGTRAAEPADEVASALSRGDFAAYEAAQNARAIAAAFPRR